MAGFDITENPTFDLRGLSAGSAYAPTKGAWDCAIGGLPFLFCSSQQTPYRRATADWRRSRFDSGVDFGEQSLDTGYWVRDQASFHYGAGQPYAEALESDPSANRFRFNSGGSIDPWTPGRVVPTVGASYVTTTSGAAPLALGTTSGVLYANAAVLSIIPVNTLTAITWGGAATISSLTTDGTNYYAASNVGIYKGALPSGAGALIWNTGSNAIIRWVKQRLMGAVGASLYELVGAGPALPTALYTHPNPSWVWTDIAEGPNAIYVAGSAGSFSTVYRITVNVSGTTVTLGAPTVVVELPRGELVTSLYSYAGTYLGIGTSSGFRLATFNSDGSLNVTPTQFTVSDGVADMVGVGRFLYVAGGGTTPVGDGNTGPGLYRVDLGTQTAQDLYAWAPDVGFSAAGSSVRSVTVGANNAIYVALSASTTAIAYQDTAVARGTAWLTVPRIRMGTTEGKVFRDIQIRGSVPVGTKIEVFGSTTGIGSPSSWSLVGQLGGNSDGFLSLGTAANGPQEALYLAFKFTSAVGAYPELYGYHLRVIPMPKKTRILELPLMCFEVEVDRNGQKAGSKGGAWTRLAALEAMEDSGGVFSFQDFTTGETRTVSVEKVSAMRMTAPSRSSSGQGMYLTVSLRLL